MPKKKPSPKRQSPASKPAKASQKPAAKAKPKATAKGVVKGGAKSQPKPQPKPPATKTVRGAATKTARGSKTADGPHKTRIVKSSDMNQLHLLFKTDLQCRNCFDYLRIHTLEELVELGPREIVDRLVIPFMSAVEKMRQRLAEVGVCLKGDESFLQHFQEAEQTQQR
jgi:hypothetical protein